MKGLLIKDFKLLKMQRLFFIVVIVMAVCLAVSTDNTYFLVGYLSFVMPMFVLSTISYDEFDNGRAFLFTLPVSRKEYVIEKYCFGMLLEIASLVLAMAVLLFIKAAANLPDLSEILISVPFIFAAMVILLSFFIPMQLKFGAEKSRIAIIAVGGIIAALGYGITKISGSSGVDIAALANNLSSLNIGSVLAGIIVFAFCAMLLSIKISIAIFRKKEF